MANVAIGTFIRFLDFDSNPTGQNFQNFYHQQSQVFQGVAYTWAGFGYSGATTSLDAGSVFATLAFATSELLLNQMKGISDNKGLVQVNTVWLDPETLVPTGLFLSEIFAVLGFDHDLQRTDVRLGDPLNAVDALVPREVLTSQLVGSLPATGNIPLS